MKINLPIEEGCFHINPHTFCGLDCYLIVPQIDAKWNPDNLHLRSIITDKEGEVLSCGFPKFFNYQEKPDCYPDPQDFNDWCVETKLDGSLLIADYVNGQFSMRTRGTVSYKIQENAKDFELLLEKYPQIKNYLSNNNHYSLLFEIVTPNNVIVIRPQEVKFYFLGAVDKRTLKLVHGGSDLLEIWRDLGCPPTPTRYQFGNLKDLSQIVNLVKGWKGQEGIVLTYNKGQNKIKIKSDWYLWIHRVKSQLNSENNLIEYYIEKEMPSHEEFFKSIETEFDFEIATQLSSLMEKIVEAGEKTKKHIKKIEEFVHEIHNFPSRREIAQAIKNNHKESSALAFSILDEKMITPKQYFDLIKQNL